LRARPQQAAVRGQDGRVGRHGLFYLLRLFVFFLRRNCFRFATVKLATLISL
jgi:hypothetical protein